MYESHFGLNAPPFQLSPDPSFYFDSKGHSNALAYLRFGAYQGEGFIVVTGEIGAGKTTLVRALLSELDTEKVVAAQVVSTQLEAGDLLKSILAAFGVPSGGLTKAELIASLEAFLTVLATRGQRALLIIDEAQNLNLEAVEEMRMLSNFQFDQHALLQSFLVGQPELRKLLQTKSMEQLRQRVIASCHLGPLSCAETRAYIEHRLRKVGWQDRPQFADESFDVIHQATGGIPRRINVLCNRVMLAAYLTDTDRIEADAVRAVADELRAEVGEQANVEALPRAPAHGAAAGAAVKSLPSAGEVMRLQRTPGLKPEHPLLLVAETPGDYLKLRALSASLERDASPLACVVVTPRSPREVRIDDSTLEALAAPPLEVCLNVGDARGAELMAQVLLRFDAQLADLEPCAVAVIGDGPAMLACALASEQRAVPLLRLDGGVREAASGPQAALLDRLATKVFTRSASAHYALASEGVEADRIQCVGSLYGGVVQASSGACADPAEVLKRVGAAGVDAARPYGVMTVTGRQGKSLARQIDALLAQLKGSLPLLWLADRSTADAVRAAALEARLERQRVVLLPMPGLGDALALLSAAAVTLVDASMVLAELAGVLHVPVIELSPDGGNAEAVAAAVADVLAQTAPREPLAVDDRASAAVREWLSAAAPIDSTTSRTASGPAGPR